MQHISPDRVDPEFLVQIANLVIFHPNKALPHYLVMNKTSCSSRQMCKENPQFISAWQLVDSLLSTSTRQITSCRRDEHVLGKRLCPSRGYQVRPGVSWFLIAIHICPWRKRTWSLCIYVLTNLRPFNLALLALQGRIHADSVCAIRVASIAWGFTLGVGFLTTVRHTPSFFFDASSANVVSIWDKSNGLIIYAVDCH